MLGSDKKIHCRRRFFLCIPCLCNEVFGWFMRQTFNKMLGIQMLMVAEKTLVARFRKCVTSKLRE